MTEDAAFHGEPAIHHLARWMLDSWRILLVSILVGAVSAGLIIRHTGPVFEATAIIQGAMIGRLGQMQPAALAGQPDLFGKSRDLLAHNSIEIGQIGLYMVSSRMVEPIASTVGRVRSAIFLRDVAKQAGDSEWLDAIERDGAGGVEVVPAKEIRGDDEQSFMQLRVKARSPEIAQRRAKALVDKIEVQQNMLAKTAMDGLRVTLLMTEKRIQNLVIERERLNKALDRIRSQDNRLGAVLQITSLLAQNDALTYDLTQIKMACQMSLDKPATQNFVLVDTINVSERLTMIVRVRFIALGMLCGLILALIGLMLHDYSRRRQ